MNISTIKLLLHLKNCSLSNKENVTINYSIKYFDILTLLYREGFIQSFCLKKGNSPNKYVFDIGLRYLNNKSVLSNLKIVSTPSLMRFVRLTSIYKLRHKKVIFFFSTNKGLLTHAECKQKKIGGKLFFIC